ncbi:hypothetical protein [Allohahella marinimesophila]|uniref:Glycosyltransferase family 2 protein n=1 Tax=Allohahella marinimesophila TaxID=1054972 RepID=A0ABP7Q9V4_9GAMM
MSQTPDQRPQVEITALVPITERAENLDLLIRQYDEALASLGRSYEFIFLLSPDYAQYGPQLENLCMSGVNGKTVTMSRGFGEATILQVGGEMASGELLLTLTPYEQIAPAAITELFEALNDNLEMVVVNRSPRTDARFNQTLARWFSRILINSSGSGFKDMGCGIRLFRKSILRELRLYGDLHRFLPLLAEQQGFRVKEIDIRQSPQDSRKRVYSASTYLGRLFDLLTIVFLTKFNQKPLRFFGAGGAACLIVALIGLSWVAIERIFFDVAAADRPLLVLFSLLLVLGVQLGAIGLVGETIIFTHAKNNKPYTIRKIVNKHEA